MLLVLYVLSAWLLALHQAHLAALGMAVAGASFYTAVAPAMRSTVRSEQQAHAVVLGNMPTTSHHLNMHKSVDLKSHEASSALTWSSKMHTGATSSDSPLFGGSGMGSGSGGSSGSDNDFHLGDEDCYESLLDRFNKWYKAYRLMQQQVGGQSMKDAVDVVREQYSQVGTALVSAECPPERQVKSPGEQLNWIGKVDYVYKSLRKLVERLETIEKVVFDGDLDLSAGLPKIDQALVGRALERTKQHVLKVAQKEATEFGRLGAINFLASTGFGQPSDFSPVLESLASVVEQLGNADTRLMVDYLRNLDFRQALANLNSLNPMAFLLCREQRDDDDEDKC